MRIVSLAVLLPLLAGPALATDPNFTMGLADVLAAESFCGLTFDQAAIEKAIAANVDADDMSFTPQLKGLMFVAEAAQKEMTTSAATAHCAQVRRLVSSYRLAG